MRQKLTTPAASRRQRRLLTLSAAILFLPASAWGQTINNVTINNVAADGTNDVVAMPGLGGADGLIIKDKAGNPATASNNNVVVTGTPGTSKDYGVAGGGGFGTDSEKNTVTISAGDIGGAVVGGVSGVDSTDPNKKGGNATENQVTIDTTVSGGAAVGVGGEVVGGVAQKGSAAGNIVNIKGNVSNAVTITGAVYGGAADTDNATLIETISNASSNHVTIDGSVTVTESVHGGGTNTGDAIGNTVTIQRNAAGNTGTFSKSVIGGLTSIGTAEGNNVNIDGGTVTGDATSGIGVVGGQATHTGIVYDNHVKIINGTVNETIFGGLGATSANATSVEVRGNTVTIGDPATQANIVVKGVVGGRSEAGNVSGNEVFIVGSDTANLTVTTGNVSGGSVVHEGGITGKGTGSATQNKVTITSGSGAGATVKTGAVVGGQARGGDADHLANADGNIVTITSGTNATATITVGNVTGAQAGTVGGATGNQVLVTGNTGAVSIGNGALLGGGAATGDATRNTVNIQGNVTNIGAVTGGRVATKGNASSNMITIDGAAITVGGAITGGTTATGDAFSNTVNVTAGNVTGAVTGGFATTGTATGNEVTITASGTVSSTVSGGSATTGTATGNKVSIEAGTFGAAVRGGYAVKGAVSGNQLIINRETAAASTFNAQVFGAYTLAGIASGNRVTINGGTLNEGVNGAHSSAGNVTGNQLTINGGDVKGGSNSVTSGFTLAGDATDNHLTINNGTVTGNIFGGAASTNVAASLTTASSLNNSVTIHGGNIGNGSTIAGARVTTAANNDVLTATGNTVTLSGDVAVGTGVTLRGVVADTTTGSLGTGSDLYTGNTLEVRGFDKGTSSAFAAISGFQHYNFTLSAAPTAAAVLETGTLNWGAGATVNLTITGNNAVLQTGDELKLIDVGSGPAAGTLANVTVSQGTTLQYSLNDITTIGATGTATVTGSRLNPSSKALSEGYLAGVALLTQGADLAVDKGIAAAVRGTSRTGLQGFAVAGGGSLRYDTGSHVQVDGFSLLAGLAHGANLASGKLTLGAFFEYGSGDYDTSNSFSSGKVKGSGDTEYTGGGVLLRFDANKTGAGHFYGEATARIGNVESDFSSKGLVQGQSTKYDIDGTYYGVHLGTGYVLKLSSHTELDLYGKHLWSRQKGDSLRLNTGDPVKFKDADSHRLRVGARLNWNANEKLSPYAGLAYEHEFDGEAKATAYGQDIDAPELKGGTGIGELGLSFKAGEAVTLDVGVQGYAGKRSGATGSLKLKVTF